MNDQKLIKKHLTECNACSCRLDDLQDLTSIWNETEIQVGPTSPFAEKVMSQISHSSFQLDNKMEKRIRKWTLFNYSLSAVATILFVQFGVFEQFVNASFGLSEALYKLNETMNVQQLKNTSSIILNHWSTIISIQKK